MDPPHLLENMFDRKRVSANPNPNSNPKAQLCFRTDEMTSFFEFKRLFYRFVYSKGLFLFIQKDCFYS